MIMQLCSVRGSCEVSDASSLAQAMPGPGKNMRDRSGEGRRTASQARDDATCQTVAGVSRETKTDGGLASVARLVSGKWRRRLMTGPAIDRLRKVAEDCRQKALECRSKADLTKDEWARHSFLESAEFWMRLGVESARRLRALDEDQQDRDRRQFFARTHLGRYQLIQS